MIIRKNLRLIITISKAMDLEPRERFKPTILADALTEGRYNFQVGKQKFEFESLPFAGVEVSALTSSPA
ncbi:MAG: hypothetical protein MGG11_19180 [Trichodesmium sp. MAG_R03]|nr:hypothetical protein [Trichodesmium sp. MAG_R03]